MMEDFTMEDDFILIEEPVESAPKKTDKPLVLLTFDRWFALQGKPVHHKLGMQAFASTKGKKAREVWDRIFAKY